MECEYGCGNEANYTFKNGKLCCSSKYRSCPYQACKIGKTRKGKTHTTETKARIGAASKQRLLKTGSPFKGKKHTDETKRKLSEKAKNRTRPDGYQPWNKGLTKENDGRIAHGDAVAHIGENNGMYGRTHTDEIKEAQRSNNILEGKWKGDDNPWFGKDRTGQNSPRFMTENERTEWESYRNEVRSITEVTYKKHLITINPLNLERTATQYHLDHIVPIWYGYKNNIPPRVIASINNLRMLWWKQNIGRSKTILNEDEMKVLESITK